ncbi:MAG: glycosyltransferase [Candidatus Aenigmarchaeota archaeon]|nr:glycosyltransferase [Candidatus Aenigmarchaeota archaeon]
MTLKISVIVPAYNEEKKIKKCIDSLVNQIYLKKEIVVINDASTDKTGIILRKYEKMRKIKLIDKKNNEGQWKGISDAQKISTGVIVMVFGGDCYLLKNDYFTRLMKRFSSMSIVAVGGVAVYKGKKTIPKVYSKLDSLLMPKEVKYNGELIGGGLAVRADVLKKIGGYSSDAVWAEDADINMKLKKYCNVNKKLTLFDPKLVIVGEYPENLKTIFRRHFLWGFGRYYILKKYGIRSKGELFRILYTPLLILSIILSFLNLSLLYLFLTIFLFPFLYSIKKLKSTELNSKETLLLIIIIYLRLLGTSTGTVMGFLKLIK